MTRIYFSYAQTGALTLEKHASEEPVDLLVSAPFFADFCKLRHRFHVGRLMLDSGAFTAANGGRALPYEEWRDIATSSGADEIVGLDVIGDVTKTQANLERAWSDGIPAIPTFHIGEPDWFLAWCKQRFSKIALGGVAKLPRTARVQWVKACFTRVWPHKVHGFGCASHEALEAVPFHSIDASSWSLGPTAFCRWAGFTGRQITLKYRPKGDLRDYWAEVVEHQKRGRFAAARWRSELAKLDAV